MVSGGLDEVVKVCDLESARGLFFNIFWYPIFVIIFNIRGFLFPRHPLSSSSFLFLRKVLNCQIINVLQLNIQSNKVKTRIEGILTIMYFPKEEKMRKRPWYYPNFVNSEFLLSFLSCVPSLGSQSSISS